MFPQQPIKWCINASFYPPAQETWYWHGDVSADSVVMSGVKCSGTEMSLAHCRHDGADVSCPRGGGRFGAGVSCSESELP